MNGQSRDLSTVLDAWEEHHPRRSEEVSVSDGRKEAALKREKALAYAFLKIWRSGSGTGEEQDQDQEEAEDRARWLDRWMATKQYSASSTTTTNRASSLDRRDSIKTLEIDTSRPYSSYKHPNPPPPQFPHRNSVASPLHRTTSHHHHPVTPSPTRPRPVQVRSASPRCQPKCYSAAQTPNFGSRTSASYSRYAGGATNSATPNYMAATESAKARIRSQSAPRSRPSTPERDRAGGSAKKRLSYPVPDPHGCGGVGYSGGSNGFSQNLRTPSFKSLHNFGSYYYANSCYTESIGGEISPCSTTDLRWLR